MFEHHTRGNFKHNNDIFDNNEIVFIYVLDFYGKIGGKVQIPPLIL